MQISNLITTNRTYKKKNYVSLIHSLFYFQRDASGFRRIYMDTLYEHSVLNSHWLFLFYLYKKHKQDLHYFMCDMIFFMFKN